MKYLLATLILILTIITPGCSGESEGQQIGGKVLDQEVRRLQPGMSVNDVEMRLGHPRLERTLREEEVLYYGRWLLIFEPNLKRRTRYYKVGPWASHPAALDAMVARLPQGTSITRVRGKFGAPEALTIYQNLPHK